MTGGNDYERSTRDAYQSDSRAAAYKNRTERRTWARFATRRQMAIVDRYLARLGLTQADLVLDAPCGTGVAGMSFRRCAARVIAGDISAAMINLARDEYRETGVRGFVRLDMSRLPLADASVTCALVLGFMHRLPAEMKDAMLRELARVVARSVIVTFSLDSSFQRTKRHVLRLFAGADYTAPEPARLPDIEDLVHRNGFSIRERANAARGVSSVTVLWLEKN